MKTRERLSRNLGLSDEMTVVRFMQEQGYDVLHCEDLQTQLKDIDVYLDGVPVSIKSQHDGWSFDNIYLELATQKYSRFKWQPGQFEAVKQQCLKSSKPVFITEEWYPGWWLTGQSDKLLIWQQTRLRLYSKYDIADYVDAHGYQNDRSGRPKIYGLRPTVLRRESGKNTVCGFLPVKDVPYLEEWSLEVSEDRRSKYKINPL